MKHTKDIMESTLIIKKGVAAIPGLKLVGDCEVMIVCFAGDVVPAIDGQSNLMRLHRNDLSHGVVLNVMNRFLQICGKRNSNFSSIAHRMYNCFTSIHDHP